MISAEHVEAMYLDCLYRFEDQARLYWMVIDPDGVRVCLHPGRVGEHLSEIESVLSHLPHMFYAVNGSGAPLSEACVDILGCTWASDYSHINKIFVLGVAIGRVELHRGDDGKMWARIL